MSMLNITSKFKSRYEFLLCFLLMQNSHESFLTERGSLPMEKAKFMAFLFDWILEKGPMTTRGAENMFQAAAIEAGVSRNQNVFTTVRTHLTEKGWIFKKTLETGSTLRLNISEELIDGMKKVVLYDSVNFCLTYETEADQKKKG